MPSTISTPLQQSDLINAFLNGYAGTPGAPNLYTGPGSVLGGIINGAVAEGVNLLALLDEIDAACRLQTALPADAVTFVQQFGFQPLGPVQATTTLTITFPSPLAANYTLPFGAVVAAGTVQFAVIADPAQTAYTSGGYVFLAGATTGSVTVQAINAGSTGNVAAGSITSTITGPGLFGWAGVSAVANAAAVTNGTDTESSQALIARFQAYQSTGHDATSAAILAAVLGVQTGLTAQIQDLSSAGTTKSSWFTVYVNALGQSTGPSGALITSVTAAVLAVRALGIQFVVQAPTLSTVAGQCTIKVSPTGSSSVVAAAAISAYQTYLNNIGLSPTNGSTTASIATLTALLQAIPNVASVSNVLLNGGFSDVTAPAFTQLVAGALTVTTM